MSSQMTIILLRMTIKIIPHMAILGYNNLLNN